MITLSKYRELNRSTKQNNHRWAVSCTYTQKWLLFSTVSLNRASSSFFFIPSWSPAWKSILTSKNIQRKKLTLALDVFLKIDWYLFLIIPCMYTVYIDQFYIMLQLLLPNSPLLPFNYISSTLNSLCSIHWRMGNQPRLREKLVFLPLQSLLPIAAQLQIHESLVYPCWKFGWFDHASFVPVTTSTMSSYLEKSCSIP